MIQLLQEETMALVREYDDSSDGLKYYRITPPEETYVCSNFAEQPWINIESFSQIHIG